MVRGLPPTATAANLESLFGRLGPLRRCFVVTEKGTKTCRGFGYVTFSLAEDAQRALREVTTLGGHQLGVTLARQRLREGRKKPQQEEKEEAAVAAGVPSVPRVAPPGVRKPKGPSRKARLIVRNLSFKCSEEDLRALFSPFGTVLEVNIPRKPDGKMRGFAFVQLQKVLEAAKALRGVNMKEIKGRPVAVDWAVAKDKYRATQEPQPQESKEETAGEAEEQRQGDGGEEEEQEEEDKEEDEEEEEEDEEEDKKATKKMKRKKKKFSLPQAADSSEEEEKEGGSEEEESSEEDEEEEDEEEEEGKIHPKRQVGRGRPPPSDVGEGRTVFIRNLSFDTEEEALGELLQQFGALQYVRVVLHPDTEHSKGCAFAQFQTQEAAQKCLQAAQEESEQGGGLRLDGRLLRIDLAVSREEAKKLRQQKPQKPKGTRNLYLAREGLIRAGTKAAEGVSDSDMAKRARFEELKHQKLRDQNIFVSRTRLCVHNLPKAVDSSRLRRLLLSLGPRGGSAPLIKECRVMREQRGQGHSLGYAFVEFGEHQQALAALRSLNNNPHIFGAQKRPIVEFSLEDRRKLRLKELRAQRSLLKLKSKQPEKEPEPTGDPQKTPHERKKGAKGGQEASPAHPGPPSGAVAWSGFQTEPVPERMQLPDGTHRRKVLALPSHRGPKIRKRDRAQLKPPPPKQPKAKARAKRRKEKHQVPPPQAQRQRRGGPGGAEARFNELVERYKRKILGSDHPPTSKRSKWFES